MSADLSPYALDPFGPSANPGAYVACEASERARAILERALDEGRVAALIGPPGHGKTLLLRLLGGREEDRARVAYLPFPRLEFTDLCALVLNEIGFERTGSPRDALVAATRELAPRGGVVILIDDAHALLEDAVRGLASLYQELGGALRIAFAAVPGPSAQRAIAAFGSAIDVVPLAGALSGREARRYVEMRLAYGGARPELVAAFDDATIEALHRSSQGVPRRLNQAAEDVVRRATRGTLPSLRKIRGLPPLPPRTRVEVAPPAPVLAPPPPEPEPPRVIQVAPPAPPAAEPPPEPESTPAPEPRAPVLPPVRPRIQLAPPPSAPAPAPDEDDDGRGILLPEIFDREPGDPSGEYRIVRGAPLAPPPRVERRRATAPGTVLVSPPGSTAEALFRKPVPMPSAYADRVPPPAPPARLPIRLIGIAGFALGVGLSVTFMMKDAPPSLYDPGMPRFASPTNAPVPAPAPAPSVAPPSAPRATPRPLPSPSPKIEAKIAPPAPAAVPAPRAHVAVSINARPWATVRIDGREVGETPLAGIELEPGPHVFSARMPDGTIHEKLVDVSAANAAVVFE